MSDQYITSFTNFIKTDEALPIACFASSLVLLPNHDLIEHPVGSVFASVVSGGTMGTLIRWFTPDSLKPYVVTGIISLTLIKLCIRMLSRNQKINESSKSTFSSYPDTINYQDMPILSQVTYNTHNVLENHGVSFTISEKLSEQSVMNELISNQSLLKQEVIDAFKTIKRLLQNRHLERMKGVYFHGAEMGYCMIKTTNEEIVGDAVMSIRVCI